MSERNQNPPSVKRNEPTPWYGWPFVAIGHLFSIWCLLVGIEWLCPLWGEVTGEHARALFLSQLDALHVELPGSVERLVLLLSQWMNQLMPALTLEFTGFFAFLTPYWHGVVYVTLSLAARVLVLFYCYPLFLLACFLGLFDGLVVRQRRKAFVDRETETKHFYSRKLLPWVGMGSSYLWLIVPGFIVLPPTLLLLPGAILTGLLVRMVSATYKKYV